VNDPALFQSRFGPVGRLAKRVVLRLFRFMLLRQAELEGRVQSVERRLPEGIAALSARLTELQREIAEKEGGADIRNLWIASERRIDEFVRRLDELAFAISQLRTSLHVTPYMSEPIETWNPAVRSRAGSFDYVGFEQIFRGPESLIRERQKAYLPLLSRHGTVLDIGCGRGEFLEVLAEANVDAVGIDTNPQMVAHCKAKGLSNVIEGDAVQYLRESAPGSIGTVFSAQVVEHLTPEDLLALVAIAYDRLSAGGVFIAETVNANSIEGAKTFFVDSTHVKPLFPETLAFLCKSVGFPLVRVFYPNGGGFDDAEPTLQPEFAIVATREVSA